MWLPDARKQSSRIYRLRPRLSSVYYIEFGERGRHLFSSGANVGRQILPGGNEYWNRAWTTFMGSAGARGAACSPWRKRINGRSFRTCIFVDNKRKKTYFILRPCSISYLTSRIDIRLSIYIIYNNIDRNFLTVDRIVNNTHTWSRTNNIESY